MRRACPWLQRRPSGRHQLRRFVEFGDGGLGGFLDCSCGPFRIPCAPNSPATRRLGDLRLQLLQFVELHFAIDVGLDIIDVALRTAEQMPERARHLGQFLRPDDEQGNHADDHEFGKADIEHENSSWLQVLQEPAIGSRNPSDRSRTWSFP
jgi:hypothetical protein